MDFRDFKPCFLIATPELKDPNFHETVVLLTEYASQGALGFVLNRPAPITLGDAVTIPGQVINPGYKGRRLWFGGPVEQNRLWLLFDGGGNRPCNGVALGDGVALARDVAWLVNTTTTLPEDRMKVICGYAGWAPRQLDAEIAANAWIVSPLNRALVFSDDPAKSWKTAYKQLGIDAGTFVTPNSPFLQ